jgi:magnesium transporter
LGENDGVIVDCAIYRHGHRSGEPADFSDALEAVRTEGDAFLWAGLYEPTEDELSHIASEFGFHSLAVEDAVMAHQRPKLEQYEDSLFVVLKTLRYLEATDEVETGEVMLFIGSGFVVTVRHGEGNPLAEVRKRLEQEEQVLRHGPGAVLYAIADAVVDTYAEIAEQLELDLEQLEAAVFSPQRMHVAERIYSLKREVLEFRRAVMPLAEPMERLSLGQVPFVDPEARPFFRDVYDHVMRVTELVEAYDDLVSGMLAANLAQVSVHQNEDMRRISAWVAILAVPTMIAGIYGMNFEHMPELTGKFGYPAVLAVMLTACAVLFRVFKRSGWL